jgi:hypothetical protein
MRHENQHLERKLDEKTVPDFVAFAHSLLLDQRIRSDTMHSGSALSANSQKLQLLSLARTDSSNARNLPAQSRARHDIARVRSQLATYNCARKTN